MAADAKDGVKARVKMRSLSSMMRTISWMRESTRKAGNSETYRSWAQEPIRFRTDVALSPSINYMILLTETNQSSLR
jgi:hypothetical protein